MAVDFSNSKMNRNVVDCADMEVRLVNLEQLVCDAYPFVQVKSDKKKFVPNKNKQLGDKHDQFKRNRAVNDDDEWKEEMTRKIASLQFEQLEAAGNSQRLAAENEGLNKEVERLRLVHQIHAVPHWDRGSSNRPPNNVTPMNAVK